MVDLSGDLSKAKKLLFSTQRAVERLETCESSAHTPGELHAISQDVQNKLRELQLLHNNLRSACKSDHSSLSKQTVWKQKLEQNEQEYYSLSSCYESFLQRQRSREMQKQERAELLLRRNGGGAGGSSSGFGGGNGGASSEAQMMRSVATSNQVLEDIFGQGSAILAGMSSQRDRLKRAQRKMLDVLNTLGVSENLLRAAERRMKMDKWIVYVGMFVITLVLYFTWRLIKA
jgi:Golgi SNAP receptor complex protein 2